MCPQLLFLFIFFPLEPFVVLWSDALKSLMHLVQNVFKSDLTRNLSQTRFVIFALVILLILACPFQWDLWWKTVCPSLLRPFLRPVSLFSCVNQPLHKDIPFWGDLSWDLSLYFPALSTPPQRHPLLRWPFLRPVSLFSCINQPLHKDIPFWGDLRPVSLFSCVNQPLSKDSPTL